MASETDPDLKDEAALEEEPEKQRLNIEVDIQKPGTCQRHITVTIPREDVDRYFDDTFSDLIKTAAVPGFRPGRAPRKLIEARFKKDVGDQVKGNLLMDSLAQVTDENNLAAISEPDFDPTAIEVPEEGPMTFEFDLEVRPEFDVPDWKGLKLERPVREFSEKDVDRAMQNLLANHGRLVMTEEPAKSGDYVATKLRFVHDGKDLSSSDEEVIRLRPVLSFRDGQIEKFDEQMAGVKAGESRTLKATLSEDAPNEALRGQKVEAVFEVQEVKKLELPKLDKEFLENLGGFETEAELREAVKENLERQLDYRQHQRSREQITATLTESADWDLPPELLKRQAQRELQRAVMELQRSGFSNQEIKAHENSLRQSSMQSTARALKEHFILERIAEEENIEDEPMDYEMEIQLIAMQSGESARRVRARLEKGNMMDVLRNQIIERKVINQIVEQATFTDVPYEPEELQTEAIDQSAGGDEEDIPQAMHEEGEAKPLPQPKDHD